MLREADVLVPNADSTLRAMLQLVLGSGFSTLGGNGRSGGVQKSDDGCEIETHCYGFYKQLVGGCSEKSMFWCQVTIQL